MGYYSKINYNLYKNEVWDFMNNRNSYLIGENFMKRKILNTIIILFGGAILIDSDAYYIPYLFITILAIICVYTNDMNNYAGETVRKLS